MNFKLDIISNAICRDYNIGSFISNEVITVGYEDFNYVLTTSEGQYCVKIFNKDRSLEACNNYIDRIKLSSEIDVNSPKVFKYDRNVLYVFSKDGIDFRLCVFEYIDGNSFFDLGIIPSDDEVKEIIRQMALIHKAKLDSGFVYDTWTIINFKKEFDKKCSCLKESDLENLSDLRKKFDTIDFEKLVNSFVHGDIITSNVIKDKIGKLWIIDYAVSNYMPRIIDLVVSACNLCLDPNSKENTINKISLIINEYEKYNKLTEYEKEVIPLFFELANGMGILQTSYQASIGNDSDENQYWLELSRKGINYSKGDF
ncbi:MAG: phosphotransferase [Clostridia bacterium]|nr:phosphotransferase [Clostridia bacterium]